nr:p22.2 [Pieris rapae granulovirus]
MHFSGHFAANMLDLTNFICVKFNNQTVPFHSFNYKYLHNSPVIVEAVCNLNKNSDSAVTIACQTPEETLNVYRFGEKIVKLVGKNVVFDGFFNTTLRKTMQFRIGDLNLLKNDMNENELEKANQQAPEMLIEIYEWMSSRSMNRAVTDGGNTKPVGYETNVANEGRYVYALGDAGKCLAQIKIVFKINSKCINIC